MGDVGTAEGFEDGIIVGCPEGCEDVGSPEGADDGRPEGADDGSEDGAGVGKLVG